MALIGDVAIVTGGSTGIGFGIVSRLLDEGARVAFFSRSATKVERARQRLCARVDEGRVLAAEADVSDPQQVAAVFDAVRDRLGPVDILVNNAGISPKRDSNDGPWVQDLSLEEWNQVLAVNLTGAFTCIQQACQDMLPRRRGRIINIASMAGRTIPLIAGPAYAASKSGMVGLTRALAKDLAVYDVTVNSVSPGRILTDMAGRRDSPTNLSSLSRIPLGRFGTPEDVANVVAFLASKEAGFVTGATIDATGGEFGN